jgi:hypothetical protein
MMNTMEGNGLTVPAGEQPEIVAMVLVIQTMI